MVGIVLDVVPPTAAYILLRASEWTPRSRCWPAPPSPGCDSITTGVLAIGFLVSGLMGKPLVYFAAQRATGGAWTDRWATEPGVRHTFTTLTVGWGAGLLAEAVIRIPLVYLLPTDTMVGVSSALQAVAILGLIGWSVRYVQARRRRAAAAQ